MAAPRLSIRAVQAFERPMRFERPFRFGAATVTEAPQAFLRVAVGVEGLGEGWGATAEMMMPKWFDKNPALTPAETVDGLRRSLAHAAGLARERRGFDSAFGHHAEILTAQHAARLGLPSLAASFGPSLVDKAVLDALLRLAGLDLAEGIRRNLPGLDARLTPDLDGFDLDGFLAGLTPLPQVAIRHTVGLADDLAELAGEARADGLRYFKLKLGGDLDADLERLRAIAGALGTLAADWRATLDANEQYPDAGALAGLVEALQSDPGLAEIRRRLLYLEQPIARDAASAEPLGEAGRRLPVIIDESDGTYDAFAAARALGYRGVSSKSCKGLYKALLNRARCQAWSGGLFVSAEDLTCQAGLAVQQDTALVALMGIAHAERNGHHYVAGFGDAPEAEADAFRAAHPDLYHDTPRGVRLATAGGTLATGSLWRPGFAYSAEPDWSSLQPLAHRSLEKEFAP